MAYAPTGVTVAQLQTFADRLQAALHDTGRPSLSQVKEAFARAAGYAHAHEAHQAAQRADQGLPLWPQVSARRLAEWAAPFRRQWLAETTPTALAVLAQQWGHPHVKALLTALTLEPEVPSLRLCLKEQGFADDQVTAIQRMLHQPVGLILLASREESRKSALRTLLFEALIQSMPKKSKAYAVEEEASRSKDDQVYTIPPPSLVTRPSHEQLIRAAMRADPEVLLIGEVRDAFTADSVCKLGESGHKTFSSMRATSVADVFAQLQSFGLSAQKLAAPHLLSGVIYHESFPCLCPSCAIPFVTTLHNPGRPDPQSHSRVERRLVEVLAQAGVPLDQIKGRGPGCDACQHTGVKGTTACAEVFLPEDVRRVLRSSAAPDARRLMDGSVFQNRVLERIRRGVISPWDAVETLTQMTRQPPLSILEVTGDPVRVRVAPSLPHLHVEAPTGHPAFVWTEAQKEELMNAFREMAALEERMNTAAPTPPASKLRSRSPG